MCYIDINENPDPIIVYPKPNSKYVDEYIYWTGLPVCCFGLVNNLFVLRVLIQRQTSAHLTILKSMAFVDFCLNAFFMIVLNFGSNSLPDNILGELACRIIASGFMVYFLSAASAWHVVILAVEFYGSSMESPWYTFFTRTKVRVRLSVILCWFVGFLISFNRLWNFRQDGGICYLDWKWRISSLFNSLEEIFFILALPVLIMIYCYWQIVKRLREAARFYREKMSIDPTTQFDYQKVTTFQKSVICRTTFIFAIYLMTWMPIQALYFFSLCNAPKTSGELAERYRFLTAQFLPMINSALNPVIYSWTWFEFRTEAFKIWVRCFSKPHKTPNVSVNAVPERTQPFHSLFDEVPRWNTSGDYSDTTSVTISSD